VRGKGREGKKKREKTTGRVEKEGLGKAASLIFDRV